MEPKKKYVIFANTLFNVIIAVQIRKGLFPDEEFDIVLSNQTSGLDRVYENGYLENVFDHIYFAKMERHTRMQRMVSLIDPGVMYKSLLGINEIPQYTDIFMWNPDRVFYSYYMHANKHHFDYKLHVYGEGVCGWFKESPDEHACYTLYSREFLNRYLRRKYNFMRVNDMDYDYYTFKPNWAVFDRKKEVIEIPSVDINDETTDLFNKIFDYPADLKIDEPVVFLATAWNEEDTEENARIFINHLIEQVGRDNFIIKRHPRDQHLSMYEELGVKLVKDVFTWDLYCLNNNIDDKILVAYPSASIMVPCAVYGNKPTVCMFKSKPWISGVTKNLLEPFVEKMQKENPKVKLFENYEDLCVYAGEALRQRQ